MTVFSCSYHADVIIMLINVKMPALVGVGILTFMSRMNFMASGVEQISFLSYDDTSGSEITPCNKIDKLLVVYRFTRNVMKSITTLSTQ